MALRRRPAVHAHGRGHRRLAPPARARPGDPADRGADADPTSRPRDRRDPIRADPPSCHDEWVAPRRRGRCGTGSPRCRPTPRTTDHRRAGRGPRADRRRRPPLPRRHLVAVGHDARPPRARARRRRCATSSTGSPTPPCWATATGPPSSWPRRWRPRCRSTVPTSCSRPTAPPPSSRPSRSPSSTGPTRASRRPDRRYLDASAGAYHGDTIGRDLAGRRRLRHRRVRSRCASRSCGPPATTTPTGPTRPSTLIERARRRAGRGRARAAGAGRGRHGGHRSRLGAAGGRGRAGRTACS